VQTFAFKITMPWRKNEKMDSMLLAANDVSPLSAAPSPFSRALRRGDGDVESRGRANEQSFGRKTVSFDEDCLNKGDDRQKFKSKSPSLRSPASIATAPTIDSDNSSSHQLSSTAPTVITLEHKVKQKKGSKFMKMLLKPSVLAVGGVIFLLTGGTAFFFSRWLTIPSLNEQIERLQAEVEGLELQVDELEAQVDRLGAEVDRLEGEVDRLEVEVNRLDVINDELAANVEAYSVENQRLNQSLAEYDELNSQLDVSVEALCLINEMLEEQNAEYASLNGDLNATTLQLGLQIDRIENIAGNLTASNRELRELNIELKNETTRLTNIKNDLDESVRSLGDQVDVLSAETRRLASLNADLTLVVSFLNETALGIQGTYEEMTEFLAEQITAYQVLAVETLQNLYMQKISRWDCDFQSYFMTKSFGTDRSQVIGENDYLDVLEYVDERILSELCLDPADFAGRLEERYESPPKITTNQLLIIVSAYTSDVLDYYFPSGDNIGLSSLDWSDAGFRCENLRDDQRYSS
jgi:septal ring factor EnvC (AmiA/AmiB activator)